MDRSRSRRGGDSPTAPATCIRVFLGDRAGGPAADLPARNDVRDFSLDGALLTYVDDEDLPPQLGVDYPPININYPRRWLGMAIESELLELFAAGKIRPVVDRTVEFEKVPAALDASRTGRRSAV